MLLRQQRPRYLSYCVMCLGCASPLASDCCCCRRRSTRAPEQPDGVSATVTRCSPVTSTTSGSHPYHFCCCGKGRLFMKTAHTASFIQSCGEKQTHTHWRPVSMWVRSLKEADVLCGWRCCYVSCSSCTPGGACACSKCRCFLPASYASRAVQQSGACTLPATRSVCFFRELTLSSCRS